jgi:hypothetical protein
MFQKVLSVYLTGALLACLVPAGAMAGTVYFNDFDGGLTVASGVVATLSGVTSTTLVQGYMGLGPVGNQFGGDFLRNPSAYPAQSTTLTLTGLPAHTSVNVNFLLGLIESWDGYGTGWWGLDTFNVNVDGVSVFSQVFAIASGYMTYLPPSGVLLSSGSHLGSFGGPDNWPDNAYNMYLEPAFQNIAHTGSSLTIDWFASGDGWQGYDDESWAIENVRVDLVPLPSTVLLLGLLGAGWRFRKP